MKAAEFHLLLERLDDAFLDNAPNYFDIRDGVLMVVAENPELAYLALDAGLPVTDVIEGLGENA